MAANKIDLLRQKQEMAEELMGKVPVGSRAAGKLSAMLVVNAITSKKPQQSQKETKPGSGAEGFNL